MGAAMDDRQNASETGTGTVDLSAGLPGRTGVIGGIESLVLDGRRFWFGFDFTSDQVLSPLIDDADAMARYAARHLRQRTGAHDASYWAELVRASVDGSDLVWRDEQRAFTTGALAKGDAGAARGHLLYLRDAATAEDGRIPGATVANWHLLFAPYAPYAHGDWGDAR